MFRSLVLVRHAKSSWEGSNLQDFDRPLNKRGFENAPMMGQRLACNKYSADSIISSPAVRAITTAEMIASEIGFDKNHIRQEPAIYEAGISALLYVIANIDENDQYVMLVGHNPGITYLCNYICDFKLENMPTCSVVQIKFSIRSWRDISKHSGELIDFDYPKKKYQN